jgi:quercetin dioxygenase-like cupin family protein
MQIALRPGQSVLPHNANSNVHLLIVRGDLTVNLEGADNQVKEGDLLPVAFQTPMIIKNTGSVDATFLVFKTPNPSEMKKGQG